MTKIMLVEDDKSLREIYGVRLLAEGYDIVSAGDGEEALAIAIKERPTLIISDVMMPKISGFDMLDILRSTTETRNVKVIMMTALSSDEQRQRGEQLGADRYLVKSQVGIEDVVRVVHEVLGDTAAEAAAHSVASAQPAAAPPSAIPPQPVASAHTNPDPSAAGQSVQPLAQPPQSASVGASPSSRNRVIAPLNDPFAQDPQLAALLEKELSGQDGQTSIESAAEEKQVVEQQIQTYAAQQPAPTEAAPSPEQAAPQPTAPPEPASQPEQQPTVPPRDATQPGASARPARSITAPPRT